MDSIKPVSYTHLTEEFIGMPNHKNLEQSNMQQEIEIVKVKQQKKMPEPTQKEYMSMKEMLRIILEDNKRHHEELRKIRDEGFRKLEETMDSGFKKMNENFRKQREDNQRYHEKFMKRMDECLKNMNKTVDSTSEGTKVNPNTEESCKEIEIREDQNALLPENKNRKDKEDVQTMERKTKKIRKTGRRKILNTKEELEMRKGGLIINVFNIPINEQRELSKSKSYRKNLIKLSQINHQRIIKKNLNKLKSQLNILTTKEYLTTSAISLIRNIPVKQLVSNTEVQGDGMVAYMRDYVRLEEVQYLSIKRDLIITENLDLNEDLVSAELQYQTHERYVTRTKIITNFAVIREKGVPELMDHG